MKEGGEGKSCVERGRGIIYARRVKRTSRGMGVIRLAYEYIYMFFVNLLFLMYYHYLMQKFIVKNQILPYLRLCQKRVKD